MARFITIAVDHGARPPDGLRVYLHTALAPGFAGDPVVLDCAFCVTGVWHKTPDKILDSLNKYLTNL